MKIIKEKTVKLKAKRVFLKKGTCSQTFVYLLNKEFGYPKKDEERAVDLMAGGIVQQGYQCGMLWGAALAVGAESFRKLDGDSKHISLAITATQNVMKSFESRAKSIECEEITKCNWSSKSSMAKYFLSGKFLACFKLTGKWAPEAIQSAIEGLSFDQANLPGNSISCASEVVRKMGANYEEAAMVGGFAGGLGLSGSGCGALAATIWFNSLNRIRKENARPTFSDRVTEEIIKTFYEETDYEMECNKICGKRFNTIDEHTEFIKNGGCDKLINALSNHIS